MSFFDPEIRLAGVEFRAHSKPGALHALASFEVKLLMGQSEPFIVRLAVGSPTEEDVFARAREAFHRFTRELAEKADRGGSALGADSPA